ncbi:MAG: HAMP domain-containing histidine kinase [Geodermatophilaceae bacterium]|jgi:signal transduction histidine kinase|nr:HAMP domain-containing histidine kinase [Geodermatophilaceae bacterium]
MVEPKAGRQAWLGSMRVRILSVVVGLLLLSSLGSVLVLRTVLLQELEQEVQLGLEQEAAEFRLLSAGNNPQTGEPFDGDLKAVFDVYFTRKVPSEGEALLSFVDGELYESRRAQDAAAATEIAPAITYWLSLERSESGDINTQLGLARYVAMPLQGDRQDGLFVVVNFPAFERREIDAAVGTQIAIQIGTLVVASLVGFAFAGRILRPLRSLASTARRITDTDLTQRIPISGGDEASQIAATFNDMLTRLEAVFATQRRFLDDTSHELRTPLTIIRGHVELLELYETPQQRQETIALITDEIDRMTEIVNDLFLLAQADQPEFLQLEPLDLRDLVREVHRKAQAMAVRDWKVDARDPTVVLGDRRRLTQAMLQLADNAAKHTAEGTTIQMGTSIEGGYARLWVDDHGAGVPTQDADRIFERFQRSAMDGARTGAGLGLAIVRAIAEAHGGDVALVRGRPGARFEITLPAAPATTRGLHNLEPPRNSGP